jgi:hypothetical protein
MSSVSGLGGYARSGGLAFSPFLFLADPVISDLERSRRAHIVKPQTACCAKAGSIKAGAAKDRQTGSQTFAVSSSACADVAMREAGA